jgi:hypothetical protein
LAEIGALTETVRQLKMAVDSLIGQTGPSTNRAVTFNDLVDLGVVSRERATSARNFGEPVGGGSGGNITGMVAGQIPIAASATSITSSANLSGDLSSNATLVTTLATVNSNVGTFQGLTINAKGLVTAAINQNYIVGSAGWTVGSVAFATGANILGQDNANLFYDNTNHRLGIGTTGPGAKLHVVGADSPNIEIIAGATRAVRIGANSGGGSIDGVDNTGVSSYQPLAIGGTQVSFWNSGTEAARITGGNVGIGTTGPGSALSVSGNISLSLNGFISFPGPTVAASVANFALSGNAGVTTVNAPSASGVLTLNTNNTERARVDSSGNVGINTTAPNAKLTVNDATAASTSSLLQSWTWSPDLTNWGLQLYQRHTGASLVYDIVMHAGSSALVNTMTFSQGNVGIGVTGPSRKLDVLGQSFFADVTNPTTNANSQQLRIGEASYTPGYTFAVGYGPVAGGNWSGVLQSLAGGTPAPILINGDGGNVGVGITASPIVKLHVGGDAIVSQLSILQLQGYNAYWNGSAWITRVTNHSATVNFDANAATWTMNISTGTGAASGATATYAARMQINNAGGCLNTTGTWTAISDASAKSHVRLYKRGLDVIEHLKPVSFRYNKRSPFPDDNIIRYGLVAQDIEPYIPEALGLFKSEDGTEFKTVDPGFMVYPLINAVNELTARVARLEARA